MNEEQALIADLKRGDHGAMESLYTRYRAPLLGLLHTLRIDRHTCEDVLHDVFLAFLIHVRGFQLKTSLKGYLFKSVTNRVRDLHRRRRPRCPTPMTEEVGYLKAPDQEAQERELKDCAKDCLCKLPTEQLEVLTGRINEGLKFGDIAERQSISSNAARARYRHAIFKLNRMMAKYAG